MEKEKKADRREWAQVCHGTASEMVVEGGEAEFVRRMLRESAAQAGVVWWTCMLGKLSSVVELAAELKVMAKSGDVGGWGVHELPTGRGRTKRWVVMWSRTPMRLPDVSIPTTHTIVDTC